MVFVDVVTALPVLRSAFSTGDSPARRSVAGSIRVLGRRSVGGESDSEPVVTVDRAGLVESWAIKDVAPPSGDSLASVVRKLVELMGKIG